MHIEELQCDLPSAILDVRELMSDLESAESCESKADFCENIRSANLKIATLKFFLGKMLKQAERCKGFSE